MAIELRLGSGTVAMNNAHVFQVEHLHFGRISNSGVVREGVEYAVEFATTLTCIATNRAIQASGQH